MSTVINGSRPEHPLKVQNPALLLFQPAFCHPKVQNQAFLLFHPAFCRPKVQFLNGVLFVGPAPPE